MGTAEVRARQRIKERNATEPNMPTDRAMPPGRAEWIEARAHAAAHVAPGDLPSAFQAIDAEYRKRYPDLNI